MAVFPKLMSVEPRPNWRIFLQFTDGVSGEVDLSGSLRGKMFEPLREPAYFALVRLSDYGAPVWPNGVDLAPDSLHDRLVADSVNHDPSAKAVRA
jgi:hypothetical protein